MNLPGTIPLTHQNDGPGRGVSRLFLKETRIDIQTLEVAEKPSASLIITTDINQGGVGSEMGQDRESRGDRTTPHPSMSG